jgi:predicted ester cyclase
MDVNEQRAAGELTSDEAERFAERFFSAFNARDADALVSLCADGITIVDPGLPRPLSGADGVHEFLAVNQRAFPDGFVEQLEVVHLAPRDRSVLVPYRFTGTMRGPWTPTAIAPTGAHVSFVGIDQWRFAGDRLEHWGTIYDGLELARQLGVLPAVDSGGERWARRLQHLQARRQRRHA